MPLYDVAPPRDHNETLAALVPADADYTLPLLLDAVWALPRFGDPDKWRDGYAPSRTVTGMRQDWTYSDARRVVQHAFGADGPDNLKHIVVYVPGTDHNEDYLTCIAILLKAGWSQDEGWMWWLRIGGDGKMSADLAAGWVSAWSLASLNACIRVGMSLDRLREVLASGVLPPPDAIETLIALRT